MRISLFLISAFACLSALGADLVEIRGCTVVPQDWADGDSFRVKTPEGEMHTIRLYGVDCLESSAKSESDARRLWAQRRYFGISGVAGSAEKSVELAMKFGAEATALRRELTSRPFTVWTAFADGRGSSRHKRIYAFVLLHDGRDLGGVLVERGLARAFGVYRSTWNGVSAADYKADIKDVEIVAAKKGLGIWQHTDWDKFIDDRRAQRAEDRLVAITLGRKKLPKETIDINHASHDELMRLPGIGKVKATQIIQGRPFKSLAELKQISGIGDNTLERLKPWIRVSE